MSPRWIAAVVAFAVVLAALGAPSPAHAQPSGRGSSALWATVGAGAGFGIGVWAGLTAFDEAINSDRKVWTSAIAGAAIGGTLGYLLGRPRRSASPMVLRSPPRPGRSRTAVAIALDERDVARLAASALSRGTVGAP